MTTKPKYPGVRYLSKGKYQVHAKVLCSKTGKYREKKKVVQASRASEAFEAREKLREELELEASPRKERINLRTYVRDSWLPSRLPELKVSTKMLYAQVLDAYVLPRLGDYYVDAIDHHDLIAFRDAQKARPATINGRLRVLKLVLRDAVVELDLPKDPTVRVKAVKEAGASKRKVLTPEELAGILRVIRKDHPQWYPLILLLSLTGLRWGEATALKWSDIDEARDEIVIRRSHYKGHLGTTKTGKTRRIPLADALVPVLREHRAQLIREQHPGLGEGWVFPSDVGTLMQSSSIRKPLAAAAKELGIDITVSAHCFRHTANNLLRQVAEGMVVRAITGHSSEAMTEHYSDVGMSERKAAMAKISRQVEDLVEGRGV